MVVSDQLKKQIIIEVIALIFLVGVIIYAFFAIKKNDANSITTQDGMVIVIDYKGNKKLEKASDGEGLEGTGVTYTITNNNSVKKNYELLLVPDVHNEDLLNQIRVSVDDLYVENLTDLARSSGAYIIATNELGPGFTKIHLIKAWYKLDTDDELVKNDVHFEYRLNVIE